MSERRNSYSARQRGIRINKQRRTHFLLSRQRDLRLKEYKADAGYEDELITEEDDDE